jgi:hypothetical protein
MLPNIPTRYVFLLVALCCVSDGLVRTTHEGAALGLLAKHAHRQAAELRTLRLCNAFASVSPLEMRRVQEPKLVEYALPYKDCHDYKLPLREQDELLFRSDGAFVGTFTVRSLPRNDSLLLLVPYKNESAPNNGNVSLAFKSHVFAPRSTSMAQVALIDATGTSAKGKVISIEKYLENAADVMPAHMMSHLQKGARSQDFQLNTIISLLPGRYNLGLQSTAKQNLTQVFDALSSKDYVAFTVGGSSSKFSEEIVIFPNSTAAKFAELFRGEAIQQSTSSLLVLGISLISTYMLTVVSF